MNTKTKVDLSLIADTGLSQGEFAELVGVSRVTVNGWMQGRTPSEKTAPLLRKALAVLRVAKRLKLLPGDMPKPTRHTMEQRAKHIRANLKKASKALKEEQTRRKAKAAA